MRKYVQHLTPMLNRRRRVISIGVSRPAMSADLSTRHELVGDLFQLPKIAGRVGPLPADRRAGRVLSRARLSGRRAHSDRRADRQAARRSWPSSSSRSTTAANCGTSTTPTNRPSPTRCCFTPSVPGGFGPAFTTSSGIRHSRCAASQLLGGAVRFWHDQLFCKPAKHGGVVAWHQDYSYWTRTKPMAHLTCWIGLDDSTTRQRLRALRAAAATAGRCCRSPAWPATWTRSRKCSTPEQWEQFTAPGRDRAESAANARSIIR